MPVRGSAIGAMKGALSGSGTPAGSQSAPGGGGPPRNSFAARSTAPKGPSIGPTGGYKLRLNMSGEGGKVPATVKWLWVLVGIEVIGGEVIHRMFRHYYGS